MVESALLGRPRRAAGALLRARDSRTAAGITGAPRYLTQRRRQMTTTIGEKVAPHPSASERAATGRTARGASPRAGHAALELPDRDPVALLEAQAPARVPELVPIRYGRMLVSPFTFYRGAAAVMAHDLAATPHTNLRVQLCGDAHLANFGGYASPERTLVFDLNDFDET